MTMMNSFVRNLIFTLLFLFHALAGICQSKSYYFKNYQVSDGLSGNMINDLIQDKKGFIWLASRNGLNRFDGRSFKIFRNIPGDTTSLGSDAVFSLCEDDNEILWIGTHKGIYWYDAALDRFSTFNLIPRGDIADLQKDVKGNIWILSNSKVYRYNVESPKITYFQFRGEYATSIHMSPQGEVWIGSYSGKILKLNPETGHFDEHDLGMMTGKQVVTSNMRLQSTSDSTLLVGDDKKLWLYNYKRRKITDLSKQVNQPGDIHVRIIFGNKPSEYWIGSETGLYILDLKEKRLTNVMKQYHDPNSISDNVITSMIKDREGGVWIGTLFGGVNYYNSQFNNFGKYIPLPGNSLSGNIVHEICKDKNNNLWVGTEDAGLNQLNLETGKIRSFLPDGEPGSISFRNVHGLVADGDKLWIGTHEHGLDLMDLKTQKVIRHYDASDLNSFGSNFIVSLYKTRTHDILVGTLSGLYKYNRTTDDFTKLAFFDSYVQSIHEDRLGTIWVGSYGGGVFYFNPNNNRKGRIRYSPDNPGGIPSDYVNSVYSSKDGDVWICTESGLSRYKPELKQFKNYLTADGLSDNQVFRVLEDDAGNFWISTSSGLSMLDNRTGKFTKYNKDNGLVSEQFNYNSSFKNDDGTLFFGTVSGMISFKPTSFVKNQFVPPVYITDMQVNNNRVDIKTNDSPLTRSLMYTKHIDLDYKSSNLSFEVASLSYVIPQSNSYQYKMEGLDSKWYILGKNQTVTFSKLPPGGYVLKVRGSNNDQLWNDKEAMLAITIRPPIWLTIWAYMLYATIVAGTIVLILRYYFLAIKEKNQRQIDQILMGREREIHSAKIDFFTHVAHEIRTPLTLIKMPLDKLLSRNNADLEIVDSLNMINRNTTRLIDLTNQLLDFRKAEASNYRLNFMKTEINVLLRELFTMFRPAAEQKEMDYLLELPRITLHAYVDKEACEKIIGNLISNAVKYGNQRVKVKLLPFSSDDLLFHIAFSNDGPRIAEEHKEKIFEPFYRIETGVPQQGTGIGLPLARSLSELHNGTLQLKFTDDEQQLFLLSLPIYQDYQIDITEEGYSKTDSMAESDNNEANYDPSKPSIMLVEDNIEILTYLGRDLGGSYNIMKATDGQQAIHFLQHENVQLVISDIMMPVMDGIELCRKMKNDVRFSHIPIILLTAKTSIHSKIEGLGEGADAYIEKPFSLDYLSAQIASLLRNRNIVKEYFAGSPLTHIKGIAFSKADQKFLEQLNTIISERVTDSNLDVDLLSSLMNMSRPTLYRKIKGISDMSPNELINLSRLKKAAALLAENNYKINEVADMVGYSVPSNFSRDFQKQFGMSPSSYVSGLNDQNKNHS
jgi:ligand-binding sensor domain-containing protein/signal transduction histidine kinase/DNA-binding response OmpR family regulator